MDGHGLEDAQNQTQKSKLKTTRERKKNKTVAEEQGQLAITEQGNQKPGADDLGVSNRLDRRPQMSGLGVRQMGGPGLGGVQESRPKRS